MSPIEKPFAQITVVVKEVAQDADEADAEGSGKGKQRSRGKAKETA
jgi:hypothetical protein